jgi:hypothetical protein
MEGGDLLGPLPELWKRGRTDSLPNREYVYDIR